MGQSVRGALMNWTPAEWRSATRHITRADGGRFTADGLKAEFLTMLAAGWEVIPVGDCDLFDKVKGCPGHPTPDAPACSKL